MSVQPPVAPHRIVIADIDIAFWRIVAILIKWTIAAIPAAIIVSIIFGLIAIALSAVFVGVFGNLPGVRL
jgi:hypothetical protein